MRHRWGVVVVASALVVAACGNSTTTGSGSETSGGGGGSNGSADGEKVTVDAPGVTDTEIRVGGVASSTNPLGGRYDTSFDGVNAYFAMVNDAGGIYGRELVLAAERDDKVAANTDEVRGLLEQDDVFAVLPVATLLFTGADTLVEEDVPTFGWTINPEWEGTEEDPRSNLFGQAGSFLCLGCAQPTVPYIAQQSDRHRVGLLGYAVPQSSRCVDGWDASFTEYGEEADAEVVFEDASLAYGTTDLSVQVSKMVDAGVDLVITCMDTNGVVTLAKEMKKQELDAIQYLPNGYDQELLDEFGDLFEGSYAYVSFAPFQADPQPPGMQAYFEWMEETGGEVSENSLVGWLNADLFHRGLQAAGPDFSRQKVIDGINEMTDYTADGLVSGVDWREAHTTRAAESCSAILKIEDSEFVPFVGEEGTIFTCFDVESGTLEPTFE